MIDRCYNKTNTYYHNYGGRGITVCDEWRATPNVFVEWAINNDWEPGLEIDRIDNDGDYSPINCHFVTHAINARNTRRNVVLTLQGESLCAAEWSERTGIPAYVIRYRKQRGWADDKILTTPVMNRGRQSNQHSPSLGST